MSVTIIYISLYIYIYIWAIPKNLAPVLENTVFALFANISEQFITTHTPAVPDVFVSGRNVGALRPARRVGFRCLADDIFWGTQYF